MGTHTVSYMASLCGAETLTTGQIYIIKHVSLDAGFLSLMFVFIIQCNSGVFLSVCLL